MDTYDYKPILGEVNNIIYILDIKYKLEDRLLDPKQKSCHPQTRAMLDKLIQWIDFQRASKVA